MYYKAVNDPRCWIRFYPNQEEGACKQDRSGCECECAHGFRSGFPPHCCSVTLLVKSSANSVLPSSVVNSQSSSHSPLRVFDIVVSFLPEPLSSFGFQGQSFLFSCLLPVFQSLL